jgi:hypothetical protein
MPEGRVTWASFLVTFSKKGEGPGKVSRPKRGHTDPHHPVIMVHALDRHRPLYRRPNVIFQLENGFGDRSGSKRRLTRSRRGRERVNSGDTMRMFASDDFLLFCGSRCLLLCVHHVFTSFPANMCHRAGRIPPYENVKRMQPQIMQPRPLALLGA